MRAQKALKVKLRKTKMATSMANLKTELKIEHPAVENEAMDCSTEPLEDGELSDEPADEVAPLAQTEEVFLDVAESASSSEAAKRFALIGDMSLAVPKKELDQLYESLKIDADNERHFSFNTINVRNAYDMKTDDVLDYFGALEPSKVDWLDEGVCNVQWDDEIIPARALLYLSIPIKNQGKRIKKEAAIQIGSDDESAEADAFKLSFPLPPGYWRKGNTCDLSKDIIMRYANKDDKKSRDRHRSRHKRSKHDEIRFEEPPKNPWGDLAQTWGRGEGLEQQIWSTAPPRDVPDLRSCLNDTFESRIADAYYRKGNAPRRAAPVFKPQSSESSSSSDSESSEEESDFLRRHKLPKMHADREEAKKKLEVACKSGDLRARLANKSKFIPRPKVVNSDESGEDVSTDWARESYVDLRRTLVNKEKSRDEDLDTDSDLDLGADDVGEMLQIEVDNEYYNAKKSRRKH